MSFCNRLLILSLCLIVSSCSSAAKAFADGQLGPGAVTKVYYRDFESTSIVNLDIEAIKQANDFSYTLEGERARHLEESLESIVCNADHRKISQNLRLLVIYKFNNKQLMWKFSKFFFTTPDGKRCRLTGEQRSLIDKIIRNEVTQAQGQVLPFAQKLITMNNGVKAGR